MGKHKIPVVLGLDKNYILQAFVVMRSILLNSKELYVFIVVTADFSKIEVEEFAENLRTEFENFEIEVLQLDENVFENVYIHNKHLSNAAYFRLLIPGLLSQYDKCIYLDCDIIVHGDLRELYEVDLDNCYLAGVRDCHVMEDTPYEREHQHTVGISDFEKYINSGVLVMNLKKMRTDQIEATFLKQTEKENWYEDQDVLNVCCYPFIKILPLQYNLFHFYVGKNIKFLYGLPYKKHEFDFKHDCPFILHMGANYKPWNSFVVRGSDEWWKIAKVFQSSENYQYYWKKCVKAKEYNEVKNIQECAAKSKYVVVWGFAQNGKQLCKILLNNNSVNIIAIADNDKTMWGEEYCGVPVKGLSEIMSEYEKQDIFWMISCRISYEQIAVQLQNFGIDKKNIFHFVNRYEKRSYLLSLSERAYEKEIEQIVDIEYVQEIIDWEERKLYIKNIIQHPLAYKEQYAYLAKKYNFQYWIETINEKVGDE